MVSLTTIFIAFVILAIVALVYYMYFYRGRCCANDMGDVAYEENAAVRRNRFV